MRVKLAARVARLDIQKRAVQVGRDGEILRDQRRNARKHAQPGVLTTSMPVMAPEGMTRVLYLGELPASSAFQSLDCHAQNATHSPSTLPITESRRQLRPSGSEGALGAGGA